MLDNSYGEGAVVNGVIDYRNFYIALDCPIHKDGTRYGLEVDDEANTERE